MGPVFKTPDAIFAYYRDSSRSMYARDIAAYLDYAGSAEAALEAGTLSRWRTYLSEHPACYPPHTINRMLSAVKRLMKEAAEHGYITHECAREFADRRGVTVKALKERLKPNARTYIAPEDMRRLAEQPDAAP